MILIKVTYFGGTEIRYNDDFRPAFCLICAEVLRTKSVARILVELGAQSPRTLEKGRKGYMNN